MDAFAQPVETLVLTDEVLQAPAQLNSTTDWIFDARAFAIDAAFVSAYQDFLAALTSDHHSRVLVVAAAELGQFSKDCIAVPTLGEAEDLIEMERIERDLGF